MENNGADSSKSPNGKFPTDGKLSNSPKDEAEIINIESSEEEDIVILEHHRRSPETSPCKERRKTSTSGKALGGHASSSNVRAPNKKQIPFKKSPNPKRSLDADSSLSMSLIGCNICGKKFKSNKSLFGHMRCHPERSYRGMEPPLKLDQTIDAASDSKEKVHSGGQVLALTYGPTESSSDKLLMERSVRGKRGHQPVTVDDDPLGVSELNSAYMFEMWIKLLKFVSGDRFDKKAKVCDQSGDVRTKDCKVGDSSNALTNQNVDTVGKGKEKMVICDGIVDEDDDEYCEILILEKGCKSGGEEGTSRNFLNADKAVKGTKNDLEEEETRVADGSKICKETNGVESSSDDRKGGNDGDDELYICGSCKEVFASGEAHKCRFGSKLRLDLNEPYEPKDI